ncbi:MAG: hypothetical protein ACLPIC_02655, partial [Rhodoblastus sp.]|uniref:hypothetical protein n=1 Tax=Rhodoblastus sp. TaxID=1962975 RepID=UPI003F9A5C2F
MTGITDAAIWQALIPDSFRLTAVDSAIVAPHAVQRLADVAFVRKSNPVLVGWAEVRVVGVKRQLSKG